MTESREGLAAHGPAPEAGALRRCAPYTRVLMAALALGAGGAGQAPAQTITTGWIHGDVREAGSLEPLSRVRVIIRDARSEAERVAETDADGRFRLELLPPGAYQVTAERIGFIPRRVDGLALAAGVGSRLRFVLEPTAPPVLELAVEAPRAGLPARLPGRALGRLELEQAPVTRGELAAALSLVSETGPYLAVDGLPGRYSRLVAEGRGHAPLLHPHLRWEWPRHPYSRNAIGRLELLSNPLDAEWAWSAGPFLRTATRSGAGTLGYRSWVRGGLEGGNAAEAGPAYDAWVAGGEVSGPLVRDTAFFTAGVEWRRTRSLQPLAPGLAPVLAEAGVGSHPGVLAALSGAQLETDGASAWARLDWRLGENHELAVDAAGTVGLEGESAPWALADAWLRPAPAGASALGTASIRSVLGGRFANEVRAGVGYESSRYPLGDGLTAFLAEGVPGTRLAAVGAALGADPAFPASFDRFTVGVDQRLVIRLSRHRLKAGFDVEWESWTGTYAWGRTGRFDFFDGVALAAGRGAFVQTVSPQPSWSSSQLRTAAVLQDTWTPAPGLDLTGGVRLAAERILRHTVGREPEWERLTGMDTSDPELGGRRVSPRLGLRWNLREVDRWVVEAGVGVYHDPVDPWVLAELGTHDGATTVRRGFGDLGDAWPRTPEAARAPAQGPALTLVGPDFAPPRSTRASLGLARRGTTSVSVAASYRHTDFLPQRRDLNGLATLVAMDQYGRPIFGELGQEGGVVGPIPGTNRRFPGFDLVSAIEATAASDYWGVTLAAERRAADWVDLSASYSWSRTQDNWLATPGRAPADQLAPRGLDSAIGAEWARGVSDFDVPHRAAFVVRIAPPAALGPFLLATYRARSGLPFTPGFRPGVDVSGDFAANDPAFIDADLPGLVTLLEAWPCLQDQRAGFVSRNACRGESHRALDLSAGIALAAPGRTRVRLTGEALNVLGGDWKLPDAALLLVDPARSLETDGQTVFVPYLVNPGFGDPLRVIPGGRVFRFGLELSF
jgi:hypothetical protein